MLANIPIVLTLLGLAGYFVTFLSYRAFYGPLGVDPEEVGLSYVDALTRGALAGAAIALIVLSFALGWVAVSIAIGVLRLLLKRVPVLGRRSSFTFKAWARDCVSDFGPFIASVVTVLLLWIVPDMSRRLADDLREGKPIAASSFSTDNPFGLHADRARLRWLQPVTAGFPPSFHRLFYLGRSDGVSVIYDSTLDRAFRIPQGAVVIETR